MKIAIVAIACVLGTFAAAETVEVSFNLNLNLNPI